VERYLPVGDAPYVLSKRWQPAVGLALVTIVVCGGLGWLCILAGLALWFLVVVFIGGGSCYLAYMVFSWLRTGVRSGVEFAIDERGIYFGDGPGNVVPWDRVHEIERCWMRQGRANGDDTDGSTQYHPHVFIKIGEPHDAGSLPAEVSLRVRHLDSFLDRGAKPEAWQGIRQAAARHAPPHVRVVWLPPPT